jgi:hypothetical protein
MRGTIFRESGKTYSHENKRFHEGGVNPVTKAYFHESAPHTVMKSAVFMRVFKCPHENDFPVMKLYIFMRVKFHRHKIWVTNF